MVETEKPICIDLFCGLGGWSEGFLLEGYQCWGFDIERHNYGTGGYPGDLVLQDVLTLHGSQFKDAAIIVASPPCQEYSYMAMPWSRAKHIARALRGDEDEFPEGYTGSCTLEQLNALFNACFRIQREASESSGRLIPLVVENVRGAQAWVGAAKANFGSFYLWGDVGMVGRRVVAAVPKFGEGVSPIKASKVPGLDWSKYGTEGYKAQGFNVVAAQRLRSEGVKAGDRNIGRATGNHEWNNSFADGLKLAGNNGPRRWEDRAVPRLADALKTPEGKKCGGGWFGAGNDCSLMRQHNSKSDSRKAASAQIAKIPLPLSRHIARTYYPAEVLI